jgi:phosphoglycerate dehydrogenase-like enzyme
MSKFRIGLSSDFRKPDDNPAFAEFDLSPMENDADVEVAYVDAVDGAFSPQALEDLDALILLVPRVGGESFHPNGWLALVARFGVGYDNVDTEACSEAGVALTITPDGVRRPVAAAIMTLILAVTGKLLIKDRLTREGRWAEKTDHNGVGLVGKTLGSVGIGNIGAELFRLAKP